MEIFTVAFFGHQYVTDYFAIEGRLEEWIRSLISEHEYVEFLIGRNGEFDQRVSSTVRRVKREYRDDNSSLMLILPYVIAEYLNNQESFEDYYDEIELSATASKAHPKAAIQLRNREMVDRANLIICFIDHESGGAYQTVKYAEKQGKMVTNLADSEHTAAEF